MSEFEKINPNPVNITLEAMKQTEREEEVELRSEQLTSKMAFQEAVQESVNPFSRLQKDQKTLESNKTRLQKLLKGERPKQLDPKEQIKEFADQSQERNPELKSSTLMRLRDLIKKGDSKETILKKLGEFYSDVTLADEALDFLIATAFDEELADTIKEAKADLNSRFGREIAAGRNIGAHAREAAEKGLGSPTSLRDMYRNITGNPRDSTTLFQELSQRYAFKDLKKVVDFLLHSLGADLKAKGTSIPKGQLHRLFTETRSLQAILGVYRFFKGRMGLVNKLFQRDGLELPPQLTFETMAKQFMGLAGERYPSGDKVLQTASRLGIEKWVLAKIIALSQFRDAIREVAVNQIYRSLQHRDELYLAILEALEELEDELEEMLEKEEEDGEGEGEDSEEEEEQEEGVT